MKKILIFTFLLGVVSPFVFAEQAPANASQATVSVAAQKAKFKARHKRVQQLIKKYKKAAEAQKPAIKEELAAIVGEQVDAQLVYMKNRIADERANLDNWEAKIKTDEENLVQVKAQRVEDLLSGAAKQKQKAAKKAWKKQMKELKK